MKLKDLFKKKKTNDKMKEAMEMIAKDFANLEKKKDKTIWEEENTSDFVYFMNEKLIDLSHELDKFTEAEKAFYFCTNFDNEVQSAGDFYSVYTSDIGNYVYELPKYFNMIGSSEIAEVLKKTNDLFEEKLPSDKEKREEYISNIYENIEEQMSELSDEYFSVSNDLDSLLYDFAFKNKDDFKSVD